MEAILTYIVMVWSIVSFVWILFLHSALEQEKWQHNHFEREADKWYKQSLIYLDAWQNDTKILADQLFKEIQKRNE